MEMWPEAYIAAELDSSAIRAADARASAWPNHASLVEASEIINPLAETFGRG